MENDLPPDGGLMKQPSNRLADASQKRAKPDEARNEAPGPKADWKDDWYAHKTMFEANPNACLLLDRQFLIVDCNPAALAFYGFDANTAFGEGRRCYPDCFAEGSGEIHKHLLTAVDIGHGQFEASFQAGAEPIPLELVVKRINRFEDFVLAVYQTDLRPQKEAQAVLERQDRLLSAVNEVAALLLASDRERFSEIVWECLSILGRAVEVDRVYIWENEDIDGRLYTTQVYEWSEGADPQQGNELTVAMPCDEVIPTWEPEFKKGNCINALVKDMHPAEQDQLSPQGIISILVVPIYMHDEFWGFIGFDDCHKERKFQEVDEKILRSGGLLLAAAMERNNIMDKLVSAKEEALASTRAKTSFLANMSHEIRTPMNAIIGMTTIAQNADTRAQLDDCLFKIESASRHLLNILNDILDMSKIESQKFELNAEPFHFRDMIENVCAIAKNGADEKRQALITEIDEAIPETVIGDEMRLFQVITNLLNNAVKFSPEGGVIRLEISKLDSASDACLLQFIVQDNGIGISTEQQKVLFNAFEQADKSISRRFGGAGLGLAISKNIITLMGGSIHVESELGKGSRFIFTIQVQVGESALSEEVPVEDVSSLDLSGYRILLAEDVEINREIVLALLEDTGVEIESAENGRLALERMTADPGRYDLIFMDIQMPEMSGFEATEKIRTLAAPEAKTIPIVAMTANAFEEDVEKCIICGMNDHIAKPIDMENLLRKTAHFLKQKDRRPRADTA